jgi:enoyl-CoA hydratase/carnithine racemase
MEERVTVALEDGVADVRLARADKMNALDPAMFAALAAAIDRLAGERGLRAVVLSGEGRGFCAGLDMAAMAAGGSGLALGERTRGASNDVQYVCTGWRALPVPVIAAAHGVAFGGGCQLLAGADVRVAHPDTRLAIREVHWGLVPDMGGYALWRGSVREDVLRELVYTARELDAAEAQACGLVTYLDPEPRERALAIARAIAARSPDAVRAAKRLFALAADADAPAILAAESAAQLALLRSPNQAEAVRANLAKRAPRFGDAG